MKYFIDGIEYDYDPSDYERIQGLIEDRDAWRKVAIAKQREIWKLQEEKQHV